MLIKNAKLATMVAKADNYGLQEGGAIAINGDAIDWIGPQENVPTEFQTWEQVDLGGRLVTPALIDCHTHIVHGGNRAREFEMRLEGASYEEVARAGGGIVSTVKATRETSEKDLLESALKRVDILIAEGVSTIEVKSGYGLDIDNELKMLRVARKISSMRPINVHTSYLGAHAVPGEYKDRADAYIEKVCIPGLNAAHAAGLVDAVDGFCEGIAFSPAQIERVFKRAKELNLPVKLHAEQLSDLGGATLAANYKASSADHLEYLSQDGVLAMAKAGTIAVVLPGAFYTLRETQAPPIELLREHGVPIAIATDSNPGSSPLTSLLLTLNMACTLFRLTPEEALSGVTRNAAKALGISNAGTLAKGQRADLAVWDVEHPSELSYRIGYNPLHKRIFGGVL